MKHLSFKLTTLLLISLCTAAKSFSQQTIPVDSLKNVLVQDWERAKAYTQDYMKAMPADKYSFKATDSVRSFAQQLLHVAGGTQFLISTGTGGKMPAGPNPEQSPTAQTADSVMYYVNSSYDFAINAIKNLSSTALLEKASFNMGQTITATRLGWIMKAFEHQTHHRGQTTIYLRLAGIKPPNERLF